MTKIGALKNKDTGEVFISSKAIAKRIQQITSLCIKDFKAQRKIWIQERLDDGDVDVRFENDYTKNVVKNMEALSAALVETFDKFSF